MDGTYVLAAGSLNDTISRLDSLSESISNGTQTLETYQYLGLDTVVVRAQPQANMQLTYVASGSTYGDAGDQYTGLDRFGRVIDQRWINSAHTPTVTYDEYKYTYDADGNVLTKDNALVSNGTLNETYTYDDLNQLTSTTRGTTAYQSWNLDALGNMNSVTTNGVTVSQIHNSQNELTGLGSSTLAYDANGNTTTDDQGHTLVYDAWNRLVEVKSGSTVLETYTYDGLGHRITEQQGSTNPVDHLYYSSQWQVVEEDIANSGLTLHSDYVWSPVFVDALILRDEHLGGGTGGVTFNFTDRVYAIQDANYNVTALVSYVNIPGDTDGDGQINLTDLSTVLNNFGHTTTGTAAQRAAMGDVNGDGHVDLTDLSTVLNNFGLSEQVTQRFAYNAYGNVQVLSGSWASTTDGFAWQYMFQGGRYSAIDSTSGLYDFRNRLYSPTMMRWMSNDPLGYVNGANAYQFVSDEPCRYADPLGTQLRPTSPNPWSAWTGPDGGPLTANGQPMGVPGSGWKWSPNPQNSRGGTYTIPGGENAGKSASWDPNPKGPQGKPGKPHWDYQPGGKDENGKPMPRRRLCPEGKDLTKDDVHPKGPPDDDPPGPNTGNPAAGGTAQPASGGAPDVSPLAFAGGMSAAHAPEFGALGDALSQAATAAGNFLDSFGGQVEEGLRELQSVPIP